MALGRGDQVVGALPGEFRRVARHSTLNLGGAAVSAVANFALILVVTLTQTLPAAGVFFTVTSIAVVAQTTCRLGADTGLVYWLSRYRAQGNPARLLPTLRTALVPTFLIAVVAAATLLLLAPGVASLIHPSGAASVTEQLRLVAFFVPVAILYDLVLAATRGLESMRATVLIERILRPVAQLALVTIAACVGADTQLLLAWLLPFLPSCLGAAALLRRQWPATLDATLVREDGSASDSPAVAAAFWRFSGPRAVTGVVQILMQRLDILLVSLLAGPGAAALYTGASRFLVLAQLGNQAIATATQPRLSSLLALGNRAAAHRLYQVSTAWLILVSWPVLLLCLVFAPTILQIFGPEYVAGAQALRVLAGAMLIATGVGTVDVVLIMSGHTGWNLANAGLMLAVMVALDLLLIPALGILGAAVAWGVALVVGNLTALGLVHRFERLGPFGSGTRTAAGICLATFAVVGGGMGVIVGQEWSALISSAILAALCAAVAAWWWSPRLELAGGSLRGTSMRPSKRGRS